MNKLFEQLLRQAGSRVLPQATRSVQGFADNLIAPMLRGVGTQAESALVRSAGAVQDAVIRPISRFSQESLANPIIGSPRTFRPGLAGQKQVKLQTGKWTPSIGFPQNFNNPQYLDGAQRFLQEFGGNITSGAQRTTASLRPGPTSAQFPLNDPLALLQGKAQYLQRQAQAGINTSQGIFRNLQNFGPTALNPLATRTPTTLLGKTGQFFNPLSRANFAGYLAEPAINAFVPESMQNTARVAAYTPGGLPVKLLSAGLYDTFLNQRNAGVGLGNGTLEANLPEVYARQQAFQNSQGQIQQRPVGSLSVLGGNEVAWKGPDLGWQRTYSEGVSPPSFTPAPTRDLNNGWQAGQAGSNMIPNGAGVLAQRPDVTNRALSQEVLNAAQQFSAPANVSLPAFYEGQQQLGRSMAQNGTLVSQLQELGGAPGMTPENLKTWAEKNPALAYREIQKLKGRL